MTNAGQFTWNYNNINDMIMHPMDTTYSFDMMSTTHKNASAGIYSIRMCAPKAISSLFSRPCMTVGNICKYE